MPVRSYGQACAEVPVSGRFFKFSFLTRHLRFWQNGFGQSFCLGPGKAKRHEMAGNEFSSGKSEKAKTIKGKSS
jgi:hypothetical protein